MCQILWMGSKEPHVVNMKTFVKYILLPSWMIKWFSKSEVKVIYLIAFPEKSELQKFCF